MFTFIKYKLIEVCLTSSNKIQDSYKIYTTSLCLRSMKSKYVELNQRCMAVSSFNENCPLRNCLIEC